MTYIIKHDFNQEIPYYVRVVDSVFFDEVYDPQVATRFKTKAGAQLWINNYSPLESNSKVVPLKGEITKFEKWTGAGMIRRKLDCINQVSSRPYNNESVDEVIAWWLSEDSHNNVKYEHWATWPKLYSITNHLWCVENYHNADTNERTTTVQIFTKKSGVFEDFESELNKVKDKITHKDDDGYLILPVFDHYLAEYGNSVYLMIHPKNDDVKITGRYSFVMNFDGLRGAFEYLKKERYYK
jgi:hypothetical protein